MEISKRLKSILAICFIGAPILLLMSSLFEGIIEDDLFKQGVIGQYGGILLIGANITIALVIDKTRPALGLFSLVVGVIGGVASAAGYMVMYSYDIASEIMNFNARDLMVKLTETPEPKMFIGGVIGLFVPFSFILNGISLLIVKFESKISAVALILAGIGFFLGQGTFSLSVLISPIFILISFWAFWITFNKSKSLLNI